MLTGVGFITIVTAAVTSAFVEASRQRALEAADSPAKSADRETNFADVDARLDQIEQTLALLVEQTRPM
jgi:hypothetical protein